MNHIIHYVLLVIAIVSGGSAATAYKALGNVSSPLKTTWRMQITCLAQLIPFLYEFKTQRERVKETFKHHIYLPILGGLSLSFYFLFWVISLQETSVAHSVLIACSVPVILVVGRLILCKKVPTSDIIGVGVGVIGLFIISLDLKSADSTVHGDSMAGLSAMCNAAYWIIGNEGLKNRNLPLWSYMITLNATTCVMCYVYSVLLFNEYDFMGWIQLDRLPYALVLGLGPGMLTHVSFNYLLKYLGSLIVTSFGNLGPIVSIMIAWAVGYQGTPGVFLWLGGTIVLAGNMIITLYKDKQKNVELMESVIQDFIDSSALGSINKSHKSKEVLTQALCSAADNQTTPGANPECADTKQDQDPEVIEFQV